MSLEINVLQVRDRSKSRKYRFDLISISVSNTRFSSFYLSDSKDTAKNFGGNIHTNQDHDNDSVVRAIK